MNKAKLVWQGKYNEDQVSSPAFLYELEKVKEESRYLLVLDESRYNFGAPTFKAYIPTEGRVNNYLTLGKNTDKLGQFSSSFQDFTDRYSCQEDLLKAAGYEIIGLTISITNEVFSEYDNVLL